MALRLVLDTGATNSLIRKALLISIGYEPDTSPDRVKVAMGNGVESLPRVMVNRFTAFGIHRVVFRVLARDLPPEVAVDGLLGLDFLRDRILTLNFKDGFLSLT